MTLDTAKHVIQEGLSGNFDFDAAMPDTVHK